MVVNFARLLSFFPALVTSTALASEQELASGHWVFTGAPEPHQAAALYIVADQAIFGYSCATSGEMGMIAASRLDGNHTSKLGPAHDALGPMSLLTDANADVSRFFPLFQIELMMSRSAPQTRMMLTNYEKKLRKDPALMSILKAGIPSLSELTRSCGRGMALGPNPSYGACQPKQAAVCKDPKLSTLDRQIADAYEARTIGLPIIELSAEWKKQEDHLEELVACEEKRDAACFQSVLNARSDELGVVTSEAPTPTAKVQELLAAPDRLAEVFKAHSFGETSVLGAMGDTIYVTTTIDGVPRAFALRDAVAEAVLYPQRRQDLAAWVQFYLSAETRPEWLEHVAINAPLPADAEIGGNPYGNRGLVAVRFEEHGPGRNGQPAGGYVTYNFSHGPMSAAVAMEIINENKEWAAAIADRERLRQEADAARSASAAALAAKLRLSYAQARERAAATASPEDLQRAAGDVVRPASGVIMPQVSERAVQQADFEAKIAADAASEGLIYRGAWFWSRFSEPGWMRAIFNGNRFPEADDRVDEHPYAGTPLQLGTMAQHASVLGWARAYEAMCGKSLPADAAVYESTTIETTSKSMITGYGAIPMGEQVNVTERRIRMLPALYSGFVRSQEAIKASNKAKSLGQIKDLMTQGAGALMRSAGLEISTYLGMQRDFEAFLTLAGCDSPTTKQMEAGIVLLSQGESGSPTGASIVNAALVSDAPQAPGEIYTLYEACLGDALAERAQFCPCVVNRVLANPAARNASGDPVSQWKSFTDGADGRADEIYRQCTS